jgi:prophage regulatory protein
MTEQGKYFREAQVLARVPFSRSTLRRRVAEGAFPAPVVFGERVKAWLIEEIEDWERQAVIKRDARRVALAATTARAVV